MSKYHRMTLAMVFSTMVITGLASNLRGQATQEHPRVAVNQLSKDDDAAIREIIAGYERAWNSHDMKAIAKLFREDAEWVNKVGMHWHGRDEIMVAHTAFHETIFKNHSFRTDAVETRSIAPGVAIAVVTETFDSFMAPDGRAWPKARNRITYALFKGADGWKIAHGQNSEIDEVAAKHDPVQNGRK